MTSTNVDDLTVPVSTTPRGSQFPSRPHPVQPQGFSGADLQKPIETNKCWGTLPIPGTQDGNLFLFLTLFGGERLGCVE